jgi:hypothetical protein
MDRREEHPQAMGRASEDPALLDLAAAHARRWLESVPGRPTAVGE